MRPSARVEAQTRPGPPPDCFQKFTHTPERGVRPHQARGRTEANIHLTPGIPGPGSPGGRSRSSWSVASVPGGRCSRLPALSPPLSGRPLPGGRVRLVARVDVWTSWPWWWISGTPPPASRPTRSRRCPAAPGGVHSPAAGVRAQSPALPGTRPGPAVRRRARPCRRAASWSWWTRDKVRLPARMPKPAPGPERRSQAPSRGAELGPLYPSVCRVAWMDGRMVYIL